MQEQLKKMLFGIIVGAISALTTAIFFHLLKWVSQTYLQHPGWIWGLPAVGLLIGLIYKKFPFLELNLHSKNSSATAGSALLASTLFTHLTGGSAGRESTAVLVATHTSQKILHLCRVKNIPQSLKNMAWAGGFSAALGAPWAGLFFAFELETLAKREFLGVLLSSWLAYLGSHWLKIPHSHFETGHDPSELLASFWLIPFFILVIGLWARTYVATLLNLKKTFTLKFSKYKAISLFLSGLVIALLVRACDWGAYSGLGLTSIDFYLKQGATLEAPWIKSLLTLITVGFGFKGGDFIPLVFIGTSLGALIHPALAPLGWGLLFSTAAQLPLTGAILVSEVFGWQWLPWALIASYGSFFLMGKKRLYDELI